MKSSVRQRAVNGGLEPGAPASARVSYRDAIRAMGRLRHGYDDRAAMEFKQALEGDEAERAFERFLADRGAEALLDSLAVLAEDLDDWATLGKLPEDSLGRRYRDLAVRDGIRARDLTAADEAIATEISGPRDPIRMWFRTRQISSHDLLHVLTDYERDVPGELLLIAFTHAFNPKRIFPISFLLGLRGVPKRHLIAFLIDAARAWRRGRTASIGGGTPWEELLRLPIDEARDHLGIEPTAAAHRGKIWRVDANSRRWRRVSVARPDEERRANRHSAPQASAKRSDSA